MTAVAAVTITGGRRRTGRRGGAQYRGLGIDPEDAEAEEYPSAECSVMVELAEKLRGASNLNHR